MSRQPSTAERAGQIAVGLFTLLVVIPIIVVVVWAFEGTKGALTGFAIVFAVFVVVPVLLARRR